MKLVSNYFLSLIAFIGLFSSNAVAQTVAITPKPASMALNQASTFAFSEDMTISFPESNSDSIKSICNSFVADFQKATSIALKTAQNSPSAPIALTIDGSLEGEAYKLNITESKISISASHPVGFFYALQTIKQLMPRNVMAAMPDASIKEWTIPTGTIADKPRFGWRGFMLDVGRHFFDKEEIKRVIDIMAVYKMNRFHWHLTEDQGWRIEIKKYPKLTEVGAWRNSKVLAWGDTKVDGIHYGGFYTQEDVKEVVAYAKERFIEIIPEIDMPGHSQAAVACYPDILACDPNNSHSVWTSQGVSYDVINVANPKAVQFAKDVIDELTELFPFGYIHLGGDECPTSKWQSNQACKDTLAKLGSTNFRDLQLHFYNQLETYIQSKPAEKQRKLIYWNEVLNGNVGLLNNPTIMAWVGADGAAKTAAQKGFDNILTPQIPYYINRKQSSAAGEPNTQGSGSETVKAVYNYVPANGITDQNLLKHYKGVQGNFWTEWVIEPEIVEYLMLPRLAAIAEAGWTPQELRNYDDFVQRIREDSVLYNLKNWSYGKHIMNDVPKVMPEASTNTKQYWYRIITTATGERTDRCIELLSASSPLIGTGNAKAGRLWSNAQADDKASNYEYQLWSIVSDPAKTGKYALVCKAQPNGSIIPTATASSTAGRWDYNNNAMNYNFTIGTYYTEAAPHSYSIESDKHTSLYMNSSLGGQNYAINIYGSPQDGNGGMWLFTPVSVTTDIASAITTDTDSSNAQIYDLNGIQKRSTKNLSSGIYIKKNGSSKKKIQIK